MLISPTRYTTHGYRVIALSVRHLAPSFNLLKVQRMETSDAEKDVDFLGFVVLENRLKPESAPVIKELQVRRERVTLKTKQKLYLDFKFQPRFQFVQFSSVCSVQVSVCCSLW